MALVVFYGGPDDGAGLDVELTRDGEWPGWIKVTESTGGRYRPDVQGDLSHFARTEHGHAHVYVWCPD